LLSNNFIKIIRSICAFGRYTGMVLLVIILILLGISLVAPDRLSTLISIPLCLEANIGETIKGLPATAGNVFGLTCSQAAITVHIHNIATLRIMLLYRLLLLLMALIILSSLQKITETLMAGSFVSQKNADRFKQMGYLLVLAVPIFTMFHWFCQPLINLQLSGICWKFSFQDNILLWCLLSGVIAFLIGEGIQQAP